MSTLRINNIEAKSVPASPTIDEKIKLTNSSGDVLVHIDGKTSGITTIGINTTDGNIKFDANSNVVVTGIITATKFVGTVEPTNLNNTGTITSSGGITVTSGNITASDGGVLINGAGGAILYLNDSNDNPDYQVQNIGGVFAIKDGTNNAERLRIGSEGNLALGGTNTSAYANQSHFFIGSTGNIYADTPSGTGKSLSLSNNAYINTSGNWVYRVGDKASNIYQYNGDIGFRTAGTGSAGNTISWTERLRISSTGQISINSTSTVGILNVKAETDGNLHVRPIGAIASAPAGSGIGLDVLNDANNAVKDLALRGSTTIFRNASSESMRIASNGQVSISNDGTTDGLLTIKGDSDQVATPSIRLLDGSDTREVSITNTSGDFVASVHGNDNAIHGHIKMFESGIFTVSNGGASGSNTERFRISSNGGSQFNGQKHTFRFDNSGGIGPYLSLQNRITATGTACGISFGCGNSDASMTSSDYGEAQMKVYTDSGLYGNMEFNLHTGVNRSYLKIVGNGGGFSGAGAGTEGMTGGVAFGNAGIAIDRSWTGQPGIHVFNTNNVGDTDQGTFRFHGWNRSYASYPGSSGGDFGVVLVADGMTLTSDRRRKTDITTITGALDTVSKMRGVSFTYVNRDLEPQTHMSMDNGKKLGFIAQEVIPLLPELILDSGEKAVELDNGYCDRYNMDYGGVTPLLVEAIKELKAENDNLKARISALEP